MVYENVEKVRIARGMTKTHLAKKIGLSLQGYIHISNGRVRLDVERLKLISEVLGVDPGVFFSDSLTDSVIYELNRRGA